MVTLSGLKTVDLDYLLEVGRQYRRIREPLWPMVGIDWHSGLHGEEAIMNQDDTHTALRPWRSMAVIYSENIQQAVARVSRLPKSAQRGFVKIPGHAVSMEYFDAPRGGNQFMVLYYQEKWVVVAQRGNRLRHPTDDPEMQATIRCALGTVLWREYMWSATFHFERSAPVVIPTDPRGALTLFRLRDKPDGMTRRPALRHWVSEHLRKIPSGDQIPVREHLRGRTVFEWSGVRVELAPSAFDAERAENVRRAS